MKNFNKINPKNKLSNKFIESKKKDYVIEKLLDLIMEIVYTDLSSKEIKTILNNLLNSHYCPYENNYLGYELIKKFTESYLNTNYWEEFKNSLSSPHQGDCVGVPCSCMRCISEEFFNNSTITWKNKNEGDKLFLEYIKNINKENENE